MNNFEKEQIKKAFNRCYGLKECVIKNVRGSVQELSNQTGLRVTFINQHLDQIKNIT